MRLKCVLSVFLSNVAVCVMLLSVCVLLYLSVFLVGLCVCVFIFYGPCCLIQINIYLIFSMCAHRVKCNISLCCRVYCCEK